VNRINYCLEYVIDRYLLKNDFNYTIIANIFSEKNAPTMLGYKNKMNNEEIKTAIVNADQEKLTLFFINNVTYKLVNQKKVELFYKNIVKIKICKINLGLRTKMVIYTKLDVVVLDYGHTFIGYKDYVENKKNFQNFMKEKFIK